MATSRVDKSRVEQGARIHGKHTTGSTSGSGSVSSDVPATIELVVLLSVLTVGATEQITATVRNAAGTVLAGVQPDGWSSADVSVVTVDGAGRITAVGAGGPVLITASLSTASISTSTPITVTGPDLVAASVEITPTTVSFQSGTAQLAATIKNAGGAILALTPTGWTSADETVCTVDSAGLVTFVGVGGPTNVTANYNAIASNACAVTGVAGGGGGGSTGLNFVKHDFEDGTFGPFFNPWGDRIDVIADPTARATGKLARIHYVVIGTGDDNRALFPTNTFSRKLGEEVWFQGDVYLPVEIVNYSDPTYEIRKLIYWGRGSFPEEFSLIFTLVGPQLVIVSTVVGPSNLPIDATYTSTNVSQAAWHTLKVQIVVNSTFAAQDGVLRVWVDGVLAHERTDMRWTDPAWTDDPATYQWDNWNFGYQVNGSHAVDEYRYWDNVSFADSEAAL